MYNVEGLDVAAGSSDDAQQLLNPKIGAQGVHQWPFDSAFPIDLALLAFAPRTSIPTGKGDLLIVSSDHPHGASSRGDRECRALSRYFEPGLLRASTGSGEEMTECLTPFPIQDSTLCPLVEASTGGAWAGLRDSETDGGGIATRWQPAAPGNAHCSGEITVERAAGALHMSPLLLWTDRPVADIGFQTGFESPGCFTSASRKIVLTAPSEYRRLVEAGKAK